MHIGSFPCRQSRKPAFCAFRVDSRQSGPRVPALGGCREATGGSEEHRTSRKSASYALLLRVLKKNGTKMVLILKSGTPVPPTG